MLLSPCVGKALKDSLREYTAGKERKGDDFKYHQLYTLLIQRKFADY
jgi:hypothetical protein